MKSYKKLSNFEKEIINYIFHTEFEEFSFKLSNIEVCKRECNIIGFYTYFKNKKSTLFNNKNTTLGKKVLIKINEINYGAGCMLYIENGYITMLEVYSHAGENLDFNEKHYKFGLI